MPALSGLSKAWVAAEGTLPPEWRLMGIARGPREVDPMIHSDQWMAWARGPAGERVDGQADSPEGALRDFTNKMRESRQAFSVEQPASQARPLVLAATLAPPA